MVLYANSLCSLKRTNPLSNAALSHYDFDKWRHVLLDSLPCTIRKKYGKALSYGMSIGRCLGIWQYVHIRSKFVQLFVCLITNDDTLVEVVWLNISSGISLPHDMLLDVSDLVRNQLYGVKGFQWFSLKSYKSDRVSHCNEIVTAKIVTLLVKTSQLHCKKIVTDNVHEYVLPRFDLQNKIQNWIKASSVTSYDAPEWDLVSDAFSDDFPDDSRLWLLGSLDVPQSFLVFTCNNSRCRILTVGTLPNFRMRGLAAKLFLAASSAMLMLGWRYWEVQVDSRNIPALKLFQSLRFKVRGYKFANLCSIL